MNPFPSFSSFPSFQDSTTSNISSLQHEQNSHKNTQNPRQNDDSYESDIDKYMPEREIMSSSKEKKKKSKRRKKMKQKRSSSISSSSSSSSDSDSSPTATASSSLAKVSKRKKSSKKKKSMKKEKRKDKKKKDLSYKGSGTTDSDEKEEGDRIEDDQLFFVDMKGDEQNLFYQSLQKSSIPIYERRCNKIIGLPDTFRILQPKKSSKPILVISKRPEFKNKKRSYAEFKRILRQPAISFKPGLKNHIQNESVSSGVDMENKYTRQEQMKMEENFILLDDFDFSLTKESIDEMKKSLDEDPEFKNKNAEFNRLLDISPYYQDVWLEYTRHQDSLLKMTHGTEPKPSLVRAVDEKKLEILKKALKYLPDHPELILQYMKILGNLKEPKEVLNTWDNMLNSYGKNMKLWDYYLDYRLGLYSSFTVSEFEQIFVDAVHAIDHENESKKYEIRLNFFYRYCIMLLQAGYSEKAIASVQAMIEVNFFCPKAFAHQSFDQKLVMFEKFWESECPRFGETNALGWENSLLSSYISDESPFAISRKNQEQIELETSDPLEKWYKTEMFLEKSCWYPLKTEDEEDEFGVEDPYRTIVFSDVQDILFVCSPTQENKLKLLYIFISLLCHGPILKLDGLQSTKDSWSLLNCFEGCDLFHKFQMNSPLHNILDKSIVKHQSKLDTSDILELVKVSSHLNLGIISLLIQVLDQSVQIVSPYSSTPFLALRLYIESLSSAKSAKKLAKSMLKEHSLNLKLWATYANVEEQNGNKHEAMKIYFVALSSWRSFPTQFQKNVFKLYRQVVDTLLWEFDQPNRVMQVIYSIFDYKISIDPEFSSDCGPLKGTSILQTQEYIHGKMKELLQGIGDENNFQDLLDMVYFSCIFEYSRNGKDVDKAIESVYRPVFDNKFDNRWIMNLVQEGLYEDLLTVFQKHAERHPYKPVDLRKYIEEALDKFPENTFFWQVMAWNESKLKIENYLRRKLDGFLTSSDSPHLWIWASCNQFVNHTSSNYAVSILERGVNSDMIRHSPTLWMLYLKIEIENNRLQKAKSLFYQAVRECAWVKSLYMLPFVSELKQVFDHDELEDLVQLMEEKEVRIRFSRE